MIGIFLNIEKCWSADNENNIKKCPFVISDKTEGAGCASDYFCAAANNKKIAGYVEWESDMPLVPDWCPKRVSNETQDDQYLVVWQNVYNYRERDNYAAEEVTEVVCETRDTLDKCINQIVDSVDNNWLDRINKCVNINDEYHTIEILYVGKSKQLDDIDITKTPQFIEKLNKRKEALEKIKKQNQVKQQAAEKAKKQERYKLYLELKTEFEETK